MCVKAQLLFESNLPLRYNMKPNDEAGSNVRITLIVPDE
jgi:hypothetical protein